MPDLIRAASLKHYADVARSVGLDPGAMLKRVELAPAALLDPDIRIRTGAVRKLLEASTAEAGIEDFGLRLAERGGLSNLGPVALIVRVQETVGAAIEAMARYIHIHNESMSVRIVRHGDIVSIVPALAIGRPVPARQSVLLLIGVVYRIIAAFMGANWHPLGVHFAHPTPRRRDTYRRFFDCNVVFGAEYDAILMLREDLERPMPSGDAALARYAREYVEGIAARSTDFEGKVRQLVSALLPTGRCSIERVADHLGCDRRTVHRQLADKGKTFSQIVDAQRTELVTRLLEDRKRSLPAVAELLGFSGQSALGRWFKERFGCTITQWRTAAKAYGVVAPLRKRRA